MERITAFEHQGLPMILLDFTGASVEEVLATIAEAAPAIRSRPERSVATITKVDGARFDSSVISALKDFVKGNERHVQGAAVVGLTGLQRIVLSTVTHFSGRTFHLCESLDEAKRRLAAGA